MYHYTKIDFAKKIISNATIKLSVYPKVNDPFDMGKDIIYHPLEDKNKLYEAICADTELHEVRPTFKYLIEQPKDKAIHQLMAIVKEHIEQWDLKKVIENTPFLCFSAAYDIPLMWGHYGDGCKGAVLEFGGNFLKAAKIQYEEFETLPSVINAERFIAAILKGDKKEHDKFGTDLLIIKHQIWSYEQEHRLFLNPNPNLFKPDSDGNRYLEFDINDLKGVYFGFSVTQHVINDFIQELKKLNIAHIKLYQMIRKPGFFSAIPQEIAY